MRTIGKCIVLGVMTLASWACAQPDTELILSCNGSPFVDARSLSDYESLGTNIVGVPFYGVFWAKADLDTAYKYGWRAVLLGANLDDRGPDLGTIASGRTWRFESENLHAGDPIGSIVHDDSAIGCQALMVDSTLGPDWFQTALTDDYIQNANNFKPAGMPYTAFFRLRAATGNHDPDDTVCRLEIRQRLGNLDSLFAETTLFVRNFTSSLHYDTFAVPFLKHATDIGNWQYRVFWYDRLRLSGPTTSRITT
jgi:hypothetical protein